MPSFTPKTAVREAAPEAAHTAEISYSLHADINNVINEKITSSYSYEQIPTSYGLGLCATPEANTSIAILVHLSIRGCLSQGQFCRINTFLYLFIISLSLILFFLPNDNFQHNARICL